MTAAHDLMALAAQWADYFDDAPDTHAAVAINIPSQRREIVSALRLAASQPDRQALERAVKDLHHTANEWADAATNGQQWLRNIVDGISTPAEALENMNGCIKHCVSVRDASMPLSAILSLLSGAGTKSDGGVEGHAERQVTDGLHSAGREKPQRSGESGTSAIRQVGAEVQISPQSLKVTSAGIKPGPSDPSPGPDVSLSAPVREPCGWQWRKQLRCADTCSMEWSEWKEISGFRSIDDYRRLFKSELDAGQLEVRAVYTHPPAPDVREALEAILSCRETIGAGASIFQVPTEIVQAAQAALTRPLGGVVQGSIARKQSTDPEGSSRTETAGGAG